MIENIYAKIGAAGIALVIIGVICVYLAAKNIIYLCIVGRDLHRIIHEINAKPQDRDAIIEANLANPLICILNDIIKTHADHSDDIKSEAAFLFNHYFSRPIRDITLIKIVAAISPLLGLLGTLLGLLGVFGRLSTSASMATSTVLAAGIWEAIYTTVMGLSLAIPALIVYHVLSIYMRSFNLEIIEYGHRFLGNSHYCLSRYRYKKRDLSCKKIAEAKNEI
ncbi:MAG: MotA/TolQ/ExbB proton channel family protein [Endomicrobium sp.]|jgi:biopolymer transport protein ExbB|nr:MotA/TolQ/ExbB proton channel family protein [Endomicrobium sp.]